MLGYYAVTRTTEVALTTVRGAPYFHHVPPQEMKTNNMGLKGIVCCQTLNTKHRVIHKLVIGLKCLSICSKMKNLYDRDF